MGNEGNKDETESQGNEDTASTTTTKSKTSKRFQVTKHQLLGSHILMWHK